ncbi:unnamed protein product [Protopolystoma xenopodis]|uniref:Uncharacterized protein n=1 Tax=Protopolystoma xenopodis TaxID=117903 RepID=A0A3S4ZRA2_9PLAT|nr:unnamed protein product [Protopolystoma xenopodis]
MVRLTYDSGDTSGNAPRLRSDFGNDHAHNGFRTRCVPLSLSTNMTKLRKQGQTTYIRQETATTQEATASWSTYLLINKVCTFKTNKYQVR